MIIKITNYCSTIQYNIYMNNPFLYGKEPNIVLVVYFVVLQYTMISIEKDVPSFKSKYSFNVFIQVFHSSDCNILSY